MRGSRLDSGAMKTQRHAAILKIVRPETGVAIRPHLGQLLPAVLVSVDGVGPLLVVKTPAGGAQALGLALDAAGWMEIIGTIAGDDAVLVITKSERARRAVQTRIKELAGIPD